MKMKINTPSYNEVIIKYLDLSKYPLILLADESSLSDYRCYWLMSLPQGDVYAGAHVYVCVYTHACVHVEGGGTVFITINVAPNIRFLFW
jgi:hypothetical protein